MRKQSLYSIILLIAISFTSLAIAQTSSDKNSTTLRRADKFYSQFDFKTAADLYERAAKKSGDDLYVSGQIGNCYRFMNDIASSEQWYGAVASSPDSDPMYKFYYAQALMANGKYEEVLTAMNSYYDAIGLPNKKRYQYPAIFDANSRYSVKIEDFNSERNDFSPYVIDSNLFFVSNRNNDAFISREDVWTDLPFTQLYAADIEKGDSTTVSKPRVYREDKISKRYHEGPICFDEVNGDMYMTRSNYSNKKAVKGANDEINLKIVKMVYADEAKSSVDMVENFDFASDDFSIAYPTVTADGQYMIFASDKPGGYGGLDLYVAQNNGGVWTNPTNLGASINTPGNDAFPHIMNDGTLFFASNGHLGLGGLDIYTSSLSTDGSFAAPVNLRAPINSSDDDFGFYINENNEEGYFTSRRPSMYGNDDIYSFQRQSFIFESIVYDSESKERIPNAKVTLTNLENGTVLEMYTDEVGYVTGNIDPKTKYRLDVFEKDYLPEQAEFTTVGEDVYAEIPLVNDYGILFDVVVKESGTDKVIPFSDVVLTDAATGKEVPKTTDVNGQTQFAVEADHDYIIKASKKITTGDSVYLSMVQEFNTNNRKAPANLYTELELSKFCVDCEIAIDNIYYDLDKYFIRTDAAYELDKLVKILRDNPSLHIELSSHTDCRASVKYNTWLSAKRAEAAVNYLIENGINYSRLTAAGYGETRPVNHCICEGGKGAGRTDPSCTEEVHQENRRTVFSITKF